MLEQSVQNQLKTYLERLVNPIELVASLDSSPKSAELAGLLEDIRRLSDKVSVRTDGQQVRRPSFGVAKPGQEPRVFFAGIPLGHEFSSLVLALLQVSAYPPKLDQSLIEQMRQLPQQGRFEVFVSLSCHNCPDVVQALNTLAVINPQFEAVMIDGGVFQAEVAERQIMAVPSVFLDGQPFAHGRISLEEIVARLDTGAALRQQQALENTAPFDVLVVGGGPAGAAAAIYAARKGIRTGVVAERFGGQVQDTLGIENFISVRATEGPKLAMAL